MEEFDLDIQKLTSLKYARLIFLKITKTHQQNAGFESTPSIRKLFPSQDIHYKLRVYNQVCITSIKSSSQVPNSLNMLNTKYYIEAVID